MELMVLSDTLIESKDCYQEGMNMKNEKYLSSLELKAHTRFIPKPKL
jgi:hypothetical protein